MARPYQQLGATEFCILLQLYDKVSLTVSHIRKLCFRSNAGTSAHKIIRKLKQLGFVQSASYDFGSRGRLEDVHILSYQGWQCLVHFDLLDETISPFLKKVAPKLIADCVHRMAIIEYWIALEIDIAQQSAYELTLFMPEFKRLENGKTIGLSYEDSFGHVWRLRNDALFIVRDILKEQEYLYLLEIDRGTVPIALKDNSRETLNNMVYGRSCIESKLLKIQYLLSVFNKSVRALGKRFTHFDGARVLVITSSAQRVRNIIAKVPIHSDLLRMEVFLLSYFDETNKGAFSCRYAVPSLRGETGLIETRRLLF